LTPHRHAPLADRLAADGCRVVLTGAYEELDFTEEILSTAPRRPLSPAAQRSPKGHGPLARRARGTASGAW
jgi:hypothetical protein